MHQTHLAGLFANISLPSHHHAEGEVAAPILDRRNGIGALDLLKATMLVNGGVNIKTS